MPVKSMKTQKLPLPQSAVRRNSKISVILIRENPFNKEVKKIKHLIY